MSNDDKRYKVVPNIEKYGYLVYAVVDTVTDRWVYCSDCQTWAENKARKFE